MPMVNIYQFEADRCDLEYDIEKLEFFANLIQQRAYIDAIFENRQQLLDLAKASGGHVRQLMEMVATSCLTAASRSHEKVTADDVTYAINQKQFGFERITKYDYYSLLARVCLHKQIDKDEVGQLLIFNLSVLEYNGIKHWNYINPVIKSISQFQEALCSI